MTTNLESRLKSAEKHKIKRLSPAEINRLRYWPGYIKVPAAKYNRVRGANTGYAAQLSYSARSYLSAFFASALISIACLTLPNTIPGNYHRQKLMPVQQTESAQPEKYQAKMLLQETAAEESALEQGLKAAKGSSAQELLAKTKGSAAEEKALAEEIGFREVNSKTTNYIVMHPSKLRRELSKEEQEMNGDGDQTNFMGRPIVIGKSLAVPKKLIGRLFYVPDMDPYNPYTKVSDNFRQYLLSKNYNGFFVGDDIGERIQLASHIKKEATLEDLKQESKKFNFYVTSIDVAVGEKRFNGEKLLYKTTSFDDVYILSEALPITYVLTESKHWQDWDVPGKKPDFDTQKLYEQYCQKFGKYMDKVRQEYLANHIREDSKTKG
jgi:hypothetical protein